MKTFLAISAIVLLCCSHGACLSGDAEIADANRRAESYLLESNFSFEKYMLELRLVCDSSPDSPKVASGETTATIVKGKNWKYEKIDSKVKTLLDESNAPPESEGVLSEPTSAEWLQSKGRLFGRIAGDKYTETFEPRAQEEFDMWVRRTCVIPAPLEWPLLIQDALEARWRKLPSFMPYDSLFLKRYECVHAQSRGQILESWWSVDVGGLLPIVMVIDFSGDNIVRSRMLAHPKKGMSLAKIKLADYQELSDTRTKWAEKDATSVPVNVVSVLWVGESNRSTLSIEANLNWYFHGEEKYEASVKRIEDLTIELEKAPIPKRVVAGAEQLAPAK